jgi:hypothetical protein
MQNCAKAKDKEFCQIISHIGTEDKKSRISEHFNQNNIMQNLAFSA